jgi:uncharacterized protein with GYD domain
VNYIKLGLRDIKKSPERLAAAHCKAEEFGGTTDKVYLTMGDGDLMTIADFFDDATTATFALRLGAHGYTWIKTMKAFPEEAFLEIMKAIIVRLLFCGGGCVDRWISKFCKELGLAGLRFRDAFILYMAVTADLLWQGGNFDGRTMIFQCEVTE